MGRLFNSAFGALADHSDRLVVEAKHSAISPIFYVCNEVVFLTSFPSAFVR